MITDQQVHSLHDHLALKILSPAALEWARPKSRHALSQEERMDKPL